MSHLWIFMVIRVASQTKNHEQFRLEKYLCHLRYLCDNKNQREEINQCEIKTLLP